MIKYYRTLQPFKVISFDLDDTLYDNSQVILLAEQHFLENLKNITHIDKLTTEYWTQWKQKIAQKKPLLCEDVVAWRVETMKALLTFHQKSAVEIKEISKKAMDIFIEWRHKIEVPTHTFTVLDQLAKKYPLVALSNGNVEPNRIGLDYFKFILRGGEQGRAKPHADLFQQTAEHFNIQLNEILHVGDNLITDVQGAIEAQCQAVWLNTVAENYQFSEKEILPTIEIDDLSQLLILT